MSVQRDRNHGTPPREDHPLEPGRATLEGWLAAVSRFALDHVDDLAEASAAGTVGREALRIAEEVSTPIPEAPLPGGVDAAVDLLRRAVTASLNTAGPGYAAYIPGGGLPAAALADLVADCVNRFTGLSAAAPALARLEADVLDWLAREFSYPGEARGLLTSGGSLANWTATVVARDERLGEGADLRRATCYTSAQAHHSIAKCIRLAGLPASSLRVVPCDAALRMDPRALDEGIRADRAAGLQPFLVVAAAGTTNTGAIDPLHELADRCERESLWLHVDAAYGGAFVLCEEGRRRLDGIGRSDSLTFDPHKGLFLPYGTGCLLVRDGAALRRTHAGDADYLQDFDGMESGGLAPSPEQHGPELSRDFRGLRLWLPFMLHGAAAFREALSEKLALTARLHDALIGLVAGGAALELPTAPELSIVTFRLPRRAEEGLEAWNARNAAFHERVVAPGRVYLSSTTLPVDDGRAFTSRACILSFRTHADRVDALAEDIESAVRGEP